MRTASIFGLSIGLLSSASVEVLAVENWSRETNWNRRLECLQRNNVALEKAMVALSKDMAALSKDVDNRIKEALRKFSQEVDARIQQGTKSSVKVGEEV